MAVASATLAIPRPALVKDHGQDDEDEQRGRLHKNKLTTHPEDAQDGRVSGHERVGRGTDGRDGHRARAPAHRREGSAAPTQIAEATIMIAASAGQAACKQTLVPGPPPQLAFVLVAAESESSASEDLLADEHRDHQESDQDDACEAVLPNGLVAEDRKDDPAVEGDQDAEHGGRGGNGETLANEVDGHLAIPPRRWSVLPATCRNAKGRQPREDTGAEQANEAERQEEQSECEPDDALQQDRRRGALELEIVPAAVLGAARPAVGRTPPPR